MTVDSTKTVTSLVPPTSTNLISFVNTQLHINIQLSLVYTSSLYETMVHTYGRLSKPRSIYKARSGNTLSVEKRIIISTDTQIKII